MTRPVLAWTEHHLPGRDGDERVALAREHGLALEVAHRPETDIAKLCGSRIPIVTLQAYGMHAAHPLHPDPSVRARGLEHLRATIELAASLRIPRVLAVCGYGAVVCDKPFESCREFFAAAILAARPLGVRILVEPLSPQRAAAMTDRATIERLLDEVDAPDVLGLALDTGHALDGGHDVERWLGSWGRPVEELQLRGADSLPPPRDVPLARWLSRLRPRPSIVTVEHPRSIERDDFERLAGHLRCEIEGHAGR